MFSLLLKINYIRFNLWCFLIGWKSFNLPPFYFISFPTNFNSKTMSTSYKKIKKTVIKPTPVTRSPSSGVIWGDHHENHSLDNLTVDLSRGFNTLNKEGASIFYFKDSIRFCLKALPILTTEVDQWDRIAFSISEVQYDLFQRVLASAVNSAHLSGIDMKDTESTSPFHLSARGNHYMTLKMRKGVRGTKTVFDAGLDHPLVAPMTADIYFKFSGFYNNATHNGAIMVLETVMVHAEVDE